MDLLLWATAISAVISLTGCFVTMLMFTEDEYREGRMKFRTAVALQGGSVLLFIILIMAVFAFLVTA